MTLTEYLDLIPQQNREAEKFTATVTAGVNPCVHIQSVMNTFLTAFDIDSAKGEQLDFLGEWIGRNRNVPVVLDFYFEWDDSVTPTKTGWDYGLWKGEFDPDTGIVRLGDEMFRDVLKAKIISNFWGGDLDTTYQILLEAYGATLLAGMTVTDNYDMTMDVETTGLTDLFKAFLDYGLLILKPIGVELSITHT